MRSKPVTTNQIQHRNFHHTLVKVCGSVLDHLDSDHLLRLQILAFHNLSKCSLTQHIQDQVSVLVPSVFRAQYVVDIQNIVTILVVVPIVLDAFARFRENTTRVSSRFVFEPGVADAIRRGQVRCQRLQGLTSSHVSTFLRKQQEAPTLMKPPSGCARRNGGCALILGCRSAVLTHFSNLGTGPRPMGGSCGGLGLVVLGERASRLYTAFSCAVADCG